jgi:hypothetical protein
MSAKKQIADIENTIVLLEEKIERFEEEHATMKQMISMQNSLIDNLQMIVKMMQMHALSPPKHQVIHVGGDSNGNDDRDDRELKDDVVHAHVEANTHASDNSKKLKHRMSRVF